MVSHGPLVSAGSARRLERRVPAIRGGNPADGRIMSPVDGVLCEVGNLRAEGKLDTAAAICRHALEQYPDDARLRYVLGCVYAQMGCLDSALPELEHAARLAPRS